MDIKTQDIVKIGKDLMKDKEVDHVFLKVILKNGLKIKHHTCRKPPFNPKTFKDAMIKDLKHPEPKN